MTLELMAVSEAGRRIATRRASVPGVTESTLGAQVFAKAVAGKRADFIANSDLMHTDGYVPEIAAGLATLGLHCPGHSHGPGPLDLAEIAPRPPGRNLLDTAPDRTCAWHREPLMKGLAEMAYQFNEPFVLDTTKFETTFGSTATPLATVLEATTGCRQPRTPSWSPRARPW